ncbi:hypothetical protein BKA70DRAFT_1271675 [Coprinopsis sp. MPI-PUGE-AT-0042]|nr:hypothetical protein BKA70DRAFT_1271675 [Coprinopsis sp. MPI-PUGE-AT-0042]
MQPHEALVLSFSQTAISSLHAKAMVNAFSIPDNVDAETTVEAFTVSHTQNLLVNLATKSVAEVYAQFGSDSDRNFENNMRIVTQNVMEIDDYMSHVWQILLQADREIFHGGSSFLTQWRTLHERFRNALRQSRDLAIHLADKIKVFYEEILPLFEDDYSKVSRIRKRIAFRRFAGAVDVDGVDESMLMDQQACERLGREFDELRVDIASFAASFEGSVRRSDEDFEKRIREIKERLRKTDEAFRRSLDPFQTIASWFGGARSSRDILNELHFLEREFGDTARLHDNIHHLLSEGLPIIHEEVDRLGPRMKVFGEIWAYLCAQVQEVWLNMNQAISDELPDFLLPDIVNETRTGYLKLYICVEQYATHLEPIFGRDF